MHAVRWMILPLAVTLSFAVWWSSWLPATVVADAPTSNAGQLDSTAESAALLLEMAGTPQRTGEHHFMLRLLRETRDPALRPYFETLSKENDAGLRVQSMLALAELKNPAAIDLKTLAEIEQSRLQFDLLAAAMSENLVLTEQMQTVITWERVDLSARLMAAGWLIKQGKLAQLDLLREAEKSGNPMQSSLAVALLCEAGEADKLAQLVKSDGDLEPNVKRAVRGLILQAVEQFSLKELNDYLILIATDAEADQVMRTNALSLALQFEATRAKATWLKEFRSTTSLALKLRLSLAALEACPKTPRSIYQAMADDSNELIAAMGKAGLDVTSEKPTGEALVALARQRHVLSNRWLLNFGKDHLAEDWALAGVSAVALQYRTSVVQSMRERERASLEEQSASAFRFLVDHGQARGAATVTRIMQRYHDDDDLIEAAMLGLVRADANVAGKIAQQIEPFESLNLEGTRLLLIARTNADMTDAQMDRLRLVVRGGGMRISAIRALAGWVYLRRTNQQAAALKLVLDRL